MESHGGNFLLLLLSTISVLLFCCASRLICAVVLFKPYPVSFFDTPATFAVGINASGICGALFVADPPHACSPLRNNFRFDSSSSIRFVLIRRGSCVFEDKVRNAQNGGYQAAIVYDDKEKKSLVSMVGNPKGIKIHAIFVSNNAGEFLRQHATGLEAECCINPILNDAAWTVLWISIISVFVILSALGTLVIARYRRLYLRHSNRHPVIDAKLVNRLPSVSFSSACPASQNTRQTCSICLEDYKDGENLRVLPCQHDFHAKCVDSWLTRWAAFCPICKHNMKN